MKNRFTFLLFFLLGNGFTSIAQTYTPGQTYWDQDYENMNYCIYNINAHGLLAWGQNMNHDVQSENHIITFTSPSSLTTDGCPAWFGLTYVDQAHNICEFLREAGGVDLTSSPHLTIRAKSDVDGAKMTVYLGSVAPGTWFPTSSTRYTGSGSILVDLTLTTAFTTYVIDYSGIDPIVWSAWTERNMVNAYGVSAESPNAKYYISRVEVGTRPIIMKTSDAVTYRTSTVNSTDPCAVVDGIHTSTDQSLEVLTEAGGHILIDPSFVTDKVVVTDMVGRTEEFAGNDFYTQLRGILVVNCISGDKVKKVKVVMD